VPAITIELTDDLAEDLRRLAAAQERSEMDLAREAVATYVRSARPLPKGMGKYRSGHGTVSERARDLLREAARERE
jgi:metal-responsive CopG/Arc/MetJ family transcriptional regulator